MKAVGVEITTWRRKIRDKALEADRKFQNENVEAPDVPTKLASKIIKGYHATKKRTFESMIRENKEETPIGLRKRSKYRSKLELD